MQIIFQDPYASLNPRMRVGAIVAEGLEVHGFGPAARRNANASRSCCSRWDSAPSTTTAIHTSSAAGSASASALRVRSRSDRDSSSPTNLVSALDLSIQAQVLNLLTYLQDKLGLAYLFISHDLRVVEHISHRVAVMYLGRIVEQAPRAVLYANPRHPYTRALLSAVPVPIPVAVPTVRR
jgi:ABC-type oligopeptide transport system ATPase subunit